MAPKEIPDELIDQLLAGREGPESITGPGWVVETGELTGPNPTDRAKKGRNGASSARARASRSGWRRRREPERLQARPRDARNRSRSSGPTAPERPQGLCLDRGYDYPEVHELPDEFGFTAHVRARGEEAQAIKHEAGFRARRWVVEAPTPGSIASAASSLAGKTRPTYLAMLHLACGLSPGAGKKSLLPK